MLDLVRHFLISVDKCPQEKQQTLRKRGHLKPEEHLYRSVHKQSKNCITNFQNYRQSRSKKKTELNFYFIMYSILIRQEKIIIKYMTYFYRVTAPTFAQSLFSCNFRSLPSADMLSDLRSERNLSLLHTHTHVPTHTHYRSACDI